MSIDAVVAPLGRTTVTRARFTVTAVFFVHGLLFASWTAHIPQIQRQIGISDGVLGTALLGAPIGSVIAMVIVGRLLPRFGSRIIVRVTLVGYCLAGITVGLTDSFTGLLLALLLWGLFQGSLDVAMNTQATEVERAHGGVIMSGFHGFWSIGGFVGALIGALSVGFGLPLAEQLSMVGGALAIVTAVLGRWMLATPPHELERGSRRGSRGRLPRLALLLGAVAFACMLCEGATADWSAVHLRTDLGSTAFVGGLGYAAYACTMVAVRLGAPALFRRATPRRLIPVFALIAAAGMTAALATESIPLTVLGFATLGIGLATVVPTAFSAAARIPGTNPGASIALVSALGWAGFVCGPPLIGHLAEAVTLPWALAVVPVLAVVIAVIAATTRVFATDGVEQAAEEVQHVGVA